METNDDNFQGFIAIFNRLEAALRHKGLPEKAPSAELEALINSLENLLETANELFNKVG